MSGEPNTQENNEQILNDIQSLQQMEQQLFNSLETNPSMTPKEQQSIVEKMNQLSNMRINLYQTLSGVNNYYENALNTSVGSLKQQMLAIEVVESELNKAKKRLEILEAEKNNKIRLVEINSYYGDKYEEHSQMMKIVIYTLFPVVILTFLSSRGLLPAMVYRVLIGLIAVVGAYFFWHRFASIITRDNMNYQEYEWHFDPTTAPSVATTTSSTSSNDPWMSQTATTTCVGDACCSSGMTYDASMNQCVPASSATSSSAIQESFVQQALTKQQPGNYKIAYSMKPPQPYR